MPTSKKQIAAHGKKQIAAFRLLFQFLLAHISKTLPILTSKLEKSQNEPISDSLRREEPPGVLP